MVKPEGAFDRTAPPEIETEAGVGIFRRLSNAWRGGRIGSFFTLRTKLVILVLIAIAPVVGERIRGLEVVRA